MTHGLTSRQARERLRTHGANIIDQKEPISWYRLLLDQFVSPLMILLCISAVVTFFLHDLIDASVIFIAVLVNTLLGFFQEYKAQNALRALSQVLSPEASVWRDGHVVSIPVSEIVPEDLVVIEAGEQIPADGVFVEAKELVMNESILTGESSTVRKKAPDHVTDDYLPLPQDSQAEHYAYMGTTCMNGVGSFRVLATGRKTQVGKIAKELSETKETETPLQQKLASLSKNLTILIIILAIAVFIFGVATGRTPFEMLLLSVAIAVSAIPEGLAISLTMILAIGMQRILKRKALVRKLVAAETLGEITMICTDKTGTLTKGELTVFSVQTIGKSKEMMRVAAALLTSPTDPLEISVRKWAEDEAPKGELNLLDELPFSSEKKYTVKLTDDHALLIGAPEVVLKKCISAQEKTELERQMLVYARKGYRLLGVGERAVKKGEKSLNAHEIGAFEWTGFFVFSDPVRKEVANSFRLLQEAGIQVKVITGDHAETARAIMQEIGIHIKDEEILLGHEFKTLSASQLTQRIQTTKLFARSTPDQKLVIVKTLQSLGEVVAMTGDGVNDAPALKQSDIGIVVSSASDVSKETADMVLLDDNFATIVAAVEEGRGMFENLRKVILYLLANAFAETIVVICSLIFGWPLPLTAIQILWVNLATDTLPSMALTIDPKEKNLLKRTPRSHSTQLLDRKLIGMIGFISILMGMIITLIFGWFHTDFSLSHIRTLSFTLLGLLSLSYVFSVRVLHRSVWEEGVRKNKWLIGAVAIGCVLQLAAVYLPPLQSIFGTESLDSFEWLIIGGAILIMVLCVELGKQVLTLFDR